MAYQAPLADMSFALKFGAGLLPVLEEGLFGDLTMDDIEAVLTEAGRMAGEVIAPLDRVGDRVGATFKDGTVVTAPGWKEAYHGWCKGGWNGLASPSEWGGQGLPQVVNAACTEMWNGASMAFGARPGFDHGFGRCAQRPWQRGAQAGVSRKTDQRRMDRHDAAHRAASGI